MVNIVVVLDSQGCIDELRLKGHAGYSASGADPACAAVTLMVRSVARLMSSRAGWTVNGSAPEPGNLSLAIIERPEDTNEWLRGVGETLLQALADIDEEFPGSISVIIEEKHNGS
jgi:uncharacterized protein YsxB (DUF464 family)